MYFSRADYILCKVKLKGLQAKRFIALRPAVVSWEVVVFLHVVNMDNAEEAGGNFLIALLRDRFLIGFRIQFNNYLIAFNASSTFVLVIMQ
jgi:hypothetical protein